MSEFATIAGQYGPWVAMLFMLLYIGANKLGPQWLASWTDERRAQKEAELSANERTYKQQAEMLKFIASATAAIQGMSGSIDQNTQQLFRLTEKMDDSGHCPLPDCPFINRANDRQ